MIQIVIAPHHQMMIQHKDLNSSLKVSRMPLYKELAQSIDLFISWKKITKKQLEYCVYQSLITSVLVKMIWNSFLSDLAK